MNLSIEILLIREKERRGNQTRDVLERRERMRSNHNNEKDNKFKFFMVL